MANAGSVEALLKLNTSGFDTGITNSIGKVTEFVETMNKLGSNSRNFSKAIETINKEMANLNSSINGLTASSSKFDNFNKMANGLDKMVKAAQLFNKEGGVTTATFQAMGSGIQAFMNSLGGVEVKLTNIVREEEQVVAATNQMNAAMSKQIQTPQVNFGSTLSNMREVEAAMNKTGSAAKTMGTNIVSSSNSASTAKQRFNGLTQTLGALRGMVSMVGSMFVYNFAFGLMQSVQNTVKAKSEMLSFLHTMGMTQGQINSFNSALDATADRFQRINKYNVGETVANIGLEFDLSAQEMEKAMSVTSMITSEYLRAGRNADEAALAVKDILQGQFQRLSRETGVKGEQLKEAGWSGDPEDVMGLLDALQKVGEARHWDTFAEKASSLNDILLITQNRLSEFATDLTEGFTPMITDSFNFIVAGVDGIISIFGQIGNALNLPDWTGTALMITGLGVAIAGVITTTITWRTGLGLLDIAHQGLGQSIMAAVFNIKAEELANASATQVIKAKLLGLNAETVAQKGLRGALAESVAMQHMENAIKEVTMARTSAEATSIEALVLAREHHISVQEAELIIQQRENIENMGAMKIITAKILSLDMEIASRHGLLVALGASVSGRLADTIATEGETVAEETLNAARTVGIALMGVYLAALLAIAAVAAVFLIPAIQQIQSANEKMGEFNNLVNNGDNIIKDARDTMNSYADKVSKLKDELSKLTEGTDEYRRKQYELDQANKDLETSTHNYKYAIEAVERARSSQAKKEESLNNTAMQQNNDLIETLQKLGYSYEEAADKANKYYSILDHGTQVNQEVANHAEYNRGRLYDKNQKLAEQLDGKEDPDVISKKLSDNASIIDAQNKQYQKMLESESLGEYVEGYLGWQWYKGVEGFTDLQTSIEQDSKILYERAMNLPKTIGDGVNGLANDIFTPLGDFWVNAGKGLTDGFNDILKGIPDLPKMFMDAIGNIFGGGEGGTTGGLLAQKINPMALLKNIFGAIDSSGIGEWFNNTIVTPLTEFFTSFSLDDLFATLTGGSLFSEGGGIIGKLLGWDENTNIGEMLSLQLDLAVQSITNFANVLLNQFMMLPVNIVSFLTQIITSITSFASQLLSQGISAGSNFLNGVVTHISQLPGRVYSFITSTASNIINGASLWVSYASQKATMMVNKVRAIVSELPGKVYDEFMKIAQRIRDAISGAVQAATQFGSDVVNAVLNALHIHSPGIIQEKIATEFANIGGRIAENIPNASQQAETFGQGIVDGMGTQLPIVQQQAQAITDAMNVSANSQAIDFSGQFVGDYQTDANTITGLNQVMTTDTAMTFGMMGETVNSTISGISTNLQTSYLNMNTTQTTALTTMQNQNKTAYTNLQNQTTSSLNNMRSTTQNVTVQMTNAWNHMKDNIIASANQLKTQSTAHFNTLSNHIGNFYRKLQNPSMWGGGDDVPTRHYNASRGRRGIQAVKQTFGITPPRKGVAGGPSPENLPEYMKLRKLKSLLGGSSIFDGMDLDQEVNVRDFLSQFDGAFGWNNWHPAHFGKIKNTSGEWNMRGPQIMHRIDTGETFKVKEFYNSQPSISFSSFQHMAEALFSAIPYEFYYNSEGHGSWQAALQAGSCNCYDGANALIALAATCGFSGHTQSGTWNGIPHIYAVINGKKMDTTGWQQRRDWNGVSAGSPPNYKPTSSGNKVTNVNIDMSGTTIYGMDDFEGRMEEIAQRVLGEEVNTSITLGI